MVPDFQEGDFAAGLVSGAQEIQGEPAAQDAQTNTDVSPGGLWGGGLLLFWWRWRELSYCSGTGAPTNDVSKKNAGAQRESLPTSLSTWTSSTRKSGWSQAIWRPNVRCWISERRSG